MTDDLSTRLQAAIVEAEAVATAAIGLREQPRPSVPGRTWKGTHPSLAAFKTRFDPAAVLRLCQAHREIVGEYTSALFTLSCHPEDERNNGFVIGLSRVITRLARAYGLEETP